MVAPVPEPRITIKSFSGMQHQHTPGSPLPKNYDWAAAAIPKLETELRDTQLMCPDMVNAFLSNPGSPGFLQLTESAVRAQGSVTVAHAFGLRSGGAEAEIGVEIFHSPYTQTGKDLGNIIAHELAHVGDHIRNYGFKTDGKPVPVPVGLHSHARLFRLCASLDKALEGPSCLIPKLEKRIADANYAPEKHKSELFAATVEHYVQNPTSVPACTATYIEHAFLPDMRLKADGHSARRAKLEMDYLNPRRANVPDPQLAAVLDTLLVDKPLDANQRAYLRAHQTEARRAVIDQVLDAVPAMEHANRFTDPTSGGPLMKRSAARET